MMHGSMNVNVQNYVSMYTWSLKSVKHFVVSKISDYVKRY